MAWEKFLLSDSYPLGGANPTNKNFPDATELVAAKQHFFGNPAHVVGATRIIIGLCEDPVSEP